MVYFLGNDARQLMQARAVGLNVKALLFCCTILNTYSGS